MIIDKGDDAPALLLAANGGGCVRPRAQHRRDLFVASSMQGAVFSGGKFLISRGPRA